MAVQRLPLVRLVDLILSGILPGMLFGEFRVTVRNKADLDTIMKRRVANTATQRHGLCHSLAKPPSLHSATGLIES